MFRKISALALIIICLILCSCSSDTELPSEQNGEQKINTSINESTPSPSEEEVFEVSFIACGDNITYGTKGAVAEAVTGGRKYNFKPQYENVSEMIQDADIAFINQEVPMAGEGYALSSYPMFNAPQELGLDLVELGFDVVNIATNHMLDKGASGLEATIDFWNDQEVVLLGGYKNREDFENIRVVEKNGIKIAFLSYTYSTNGITKSQSSPIVIPYINDEDILRQTAAAKELSDLVVVSMHWGEEYHFEPSAEQRRLAKLMADSGADAIIGHHPHVIQPVEWIEGINGNRTLCIYSLGNFVAQQDHDYSMVGGIAELTFKKTGNNTEISSVLFHPTVFHFANVFLTNRVYLMEQYTPELASQHGVRTYYANPLSYKDLIGYAKNTISEEFLTESFKDAFKNY